MGSIAHILLRGGGEFMSCGDISAILISAVGILFSLITYCKTVNREKRFLQHKNFQKLEKGIPMYLQMWHLTTTD